MIPELYSQVALNCDVPSAKLKRGDMATYIDLLEHPLGEEAGAVLEVFNALGDSIAVVTVPLSAIEPLRAEHIPTVRYW
ncbi:MAG: DUF4926 domain-containing protein [Phototrophicaceae bacterium]